VYLLYSHSINAIVIPRLYKRDSSGIDKISNMDPNSSTNTFAMVNMVCSFLFSALVHRKKTHIITRYTRSTPKHIPRIHAGMEIPTMYIINGSNNILNAFHTGIKSYSNLSPKIKVGRMCKNPSCYFHYAYGFATQTLATHLDSLVRVPRRVG